MEENPQIVQAETDFADLKNQYDLFFQGSRRGEPTRERKELENRLLALSRRSLPNSAEQLRFNNLLGKFWSSVNLWARIVRDFEEGRLRRDKTGALTRVGVNWSPEPEPTEPHPSASEPAVEMILHHHDEAEHFHQVAKELLEIRKQCGMKADVSELAALRDALQSRAQEISASAGGKKVEFRVSVEGGKPKIKARLS